MQLRPIVERGTNIPIGYTFWCPGCQMHHQIHTIKKDNNPVWSFNGNLENPTFSPSLVTNTFGPNDIRKCHLYISEGYIHYLSDCFHDLRGTTIRMAEDTIE